MLRAYQFEAAGARELDAIIARRGKPRTCVTDNGGNSSFAPDNRSARFAVVLCLSIVIGALLAANLLRTRYRGSLGEVRTRKKTVVQRLPFSSQINTDKIRD